MAFSTRRNSKQPPLTQLFAVLFAIFCGKGVSFIEFSPQKDYRSPTKGDLPAIVKEETVEVSSTDSFQEFASFIQDKQNEICRILEQTDGTGRFIVDDWERGSGPNSGTGSTRVLENGSLIEKGAVSVSIIHGVLSAERAQSMASRNREGINPNGGQTYSAAALSLVLHSASPLVPTFRSDVRYFQVEGQPGWFGGGADLTPYYLEEEDVTEFHKLYQGICSKYDPSGQVYTRLKKWCDDYFYIPIRKEHRGTGGIFFDDFQDGDLEGKSAQAFTQDVANAFMPSYLQIVEKRRHLSFTDKQREWQLLRRGRYLEFNLLYDRGVKFGLNGGRVESVMVSAPPLIAWKYNVQLDEGSDEAKLVEVLQNPKEWV